ncbi:zinc finger protein 226-like [Sabethes cyaneus]|uniref:zinc finger protein 226-like n=1 Tax=Sabethes cyaneus TaxID=53552 RepID=UPI00237EC8DF|nr:zinc finger protein 226-like [Sabethes cyaneus]
MDAPGPEVNSIKTEESAEIKVEEASFSGSHEGEADLATGETEECFDELSDMAAALPPGAGDIKPEPTSELDTSDGDTGACGVEIPTDDGEQHAASSSSGVDPGLLDRNHATDQRRKHACGICDKKLTKKHLLVAHMRMHTGERPFVCDICGRNFARSSTLRVHKVTIHKLEDVFELEEDDHRHILTSVLETNGPAAGQEERKHACAVCDRRFTLKLSLIRHERKHTGERRFKCDICGLTISSTSNLNAHKSIVHGKDRPYRCEICGQGFLFRCRLVRHMNFHSNERPYKCDICVLAYKSVGNLRTHMKLHTSVESSPFRCDRCGARAGDVFEINRAEDYQQKHTCEKCGKTASSSAHLKRHTCGKPHKCVECDRRFTNVEIKHVVHFIEQPTTQMQRIILAVLSAMSRGPEENSISENPTGYIQVNFFQQVTAVNYSHQQVKDY